MIKLIGYKYFINLLDSKFTVFLFFTCSTCIFSEFIFLKYHCIFFYCKNIDLNIREPHIHQMRYFIGFNYQILLGFFMSSY